MQCIRIRLSMQGHRFYPWSQKSPHTVGQLSPCTTTGAHGVRSRAHEPPLRSLCTLSLCTLTTEARSPRACAPQRKETPQGEAHAPQGAPARCNQRKSAQSNKDPAKTKINFFKNLKLKKVIV